MSRIFLEIVCPVLEGVELEAKTMSQAILFCPISCDLISPFSSWATRENKTSPLLILSSYGKENTGFHSSANGDFWTTYVAAFGRIVNSACDGLDVGGFCGCVETVVLEGEEACVGL